MTPHRPLRSEVEKERRLSRPTSGQFSTASSRPSSGCVTIRGASSENSSNRDSVGTTDSTTSEDDNQPPPLPIKARTDPDYCNLPEPDFSASPVNERVNNTIQRLAHKPPLPEPTDHGVPPQPPPKPPKKPLPS